MAMLIALMALMVSLMTLAVVFAVARNVNHMQEQMNTWLSTTTMLDTAIQHPRQGSQGWEVTIKEPRRSERIVELPAMTEGKAVLEMVRRGIDPKYIKEMRER